MGRFKLRLCVPNCNSGNPSTAKQQFWCCDLSTRKQNANIKPGMKKDSCMEQSKTDTRDESLQELFMVSAISIVSILKAIKDAKAEKPPF
jgi:hypothetical protein